MVDSLNNFSMFPFSAQNFILNRTWQEKDAQHAWDLKDPDQ